MNVKAAVIQIHDESLMKKCGIVYLNGVLHLNKKDILIALYIKCSCDCNI